MPRYWRVDFIDGDFSLVTSPSLLDAHLIAAYQQELTKCLQGFHVWTAEEADKKLYPLFAKYYQKIGDLLVPKIDCDRLVPTSRHNLFVCTEPIEQRGKLIVGLSGLDQLMGYSYREDQETEQFETVTLTTGDSRLDTLTDALLIFKNRAWTLAGSYSQEDISKMNHQANERMRPVEDDKKSSGTGQPLRKTPTTETVVAPASMTPEVIAKLKSINVPMPQL